MSTATVRFPVWTVVSGILLTMSPLDAHNGRVALAHPITDITIDGDLSDWPDDLPRYAIDRSYVAAPVDSNDFRASFRVGYQGSFLFVAVEAHDDTSLITVAEGRPLGSLDGCHVAVALQHGGPSTDLTDFMIHGDVQDARRGLGSIDDLELAISRRGKSQTYEFRIDLQGLSDDPAHLPGTVVGLNVGLDDLGANTESSALVGAEVGFVFSWITAATSPCHSPTTTA